MPGLDFSFSGLKTALLYAVRELTSESSSARRADLAASYQRAIVTALTRRLRDAAEQPVSIGSPSSAAWPRTRELRAALPDAVLAPLALCTDNAAMIASAARFTEPVPMPEALSLDAYASAA